MVFRLKDPLYPAWEPDRSRRGSRRGAVRAVLARGSDALHTRASAPAPACSVLVLCDAHQRKTAAEQARGGPAPSPSAATARGGSALGVRAKPVPNGHGAVDATGRVAEGLAAVDAVAKDSGFDAWSEHRHAGTSNTPNAFNEQPWDHPAWGARGEAHEALKGREGV